MTITECVAVSYNQKIINEPLDKVKSNEVNPRGVNCRVERNLTEQEMLKDIVAESKNKWILQEIIRDVKVSWLKQIKLMKPDRKEMIPHEECVGIKYNKPVKVREEIRHTIENNNSKKEDELTNERRYSHGNHIENELEESKKNETRAGILRKVKLKGRNKPAKGEILNGEKHMRNDGPEEEPTATIVSESGLMHASNAELQETRNDLRGRMLGRTEIDRKLLDISRKMKDDVSKASPKLL